MKISITQLQKPKLVEFSGDETWLEPVYSAFYKGRGGKLQGYVKIVAEDYGYAAASGEFSYTPKLDCSRCDKKIDWPLAGPFSVRYKPMEEDQPVHDGEDLSTSELDVYYLDQDNQIDLEQLMIDLVLSEIPQQVVARSDDGKACKICAADLTSSAVYESVGAEESNPFAVLRNLKLSD